MTIHNAHLIQLTVLLSKIQQPVAAMYMAKGEPAQALLELRCNNAPLWLAGNIREHWPIVESAERLHADGL